MRQATDLAMRPLIAHCHRGLSESHLHLGNEKKAQLENETALDLYHSLGMTYWQSAG
jgi:hypothetical protein